MPTTDVALALFTRANLLVVGDYEAIDRLVASIWPSLATPIHVRRRGERLRLPPASRTIGTVVVRDVDTLTPGEQRALCRWIGASKGRAQVVSTASKSLLPMVAAGAFNEDAYYRLNVVTLDLTFLLC